MQHFVSYNSVVRKIWGKSDTVLFIFAGAAAEFALNKAVDWLYYTGRLPKDPLGRLFSTVLYARRIVFSDQDTALKTIDNMASIHKAVEESRGARIPDWAYRDVLYMLIDYSIRSWELLKRKLSEREKEEVFNVFIKVGVRMGLKDLPEDFKTWKISRSQHLSKDLKKSSYTLDLFRQYKKHLGLTRYFILLEVQKLLVPEIVRRHLGFRSGFLLIPVLWGYRIIAELKLDKPVKSLILPKQYKKEIAALEV